MLIQYEDLNLSNGESFITQWLKNQPREYNEVDFLPPPMNTPKHIYNTFKGYRASNLPPNETEQDINIFLNHIKVLAGNDDKSYNYFIHCLAQIVQQPGFKPGVSIVLRSDEGVGKNIFLENFAEKILGEKYVLQTADINDVVGRFTLINNKMMVIVDEVNAKDSFASCDLLKNVITAEKIRWERKEIDAINLNNCARYFYLSNNDIVVKISPSDRRFVVFQCANDFVKNQDYFTKLSSAFNDDNMVKAFYDYLMNIDLSMFKKDDRPITDAYKEIQQASLPPFIHFVNNLVEDYEYKKELSNGTKLDQEQRDNCFNEYKFIKEQTAMEVFHFFNKWKENNGYDKVEMNTTKLGRELMKIEGIERRKTKTHNRYIFDYEKIKIYIKDKYKL